MNENSPPGTPRLDALLADGVITDAQHASSQRKIGHGIIDENWVCDLYLADSDDPYSQGAVNAKHRELHQTRVRSETTNRRYRRPIRTVTRNHRTSRAPRQSRRVRRTASSTSSPPGSSESDPPGHRDVGQRDAGCVA